jgi:hypothetical protein
MKKLLPVIFAVLFVLLTGCCATKTVFSADGNVPTGTVSGTISISACTPMEKEVASEMARLSDWYRVHWDNCGTNSDPTTCRGELSKAYQEQQKMLLDVLAAMNGQPKAEQKKMYQQMRLNNRLMLE